MLMRQMVLSYSSSSMTLGSKKINKKESYLHKQCKVQNSAHTPIAYSGGSYDVHDEWRNVLLSHEENGKMS